MMERGTRASPAPASTIALRFLVSLAVAAITACAGGPQPAGSSSGPPMIVLPPESWPPECPLVFVDAKGEPLRGAVRSDSVRLRAFGLEAIVRDARVDEDGGVIASSVVFGAAKGRKGGRLLLPESRLAPSLADPAAGCIEFSTADGWRVGLEGSAPDASFSGQLRSLPSERLPGATASSSARFESLSLTGRAKADWSKASVSKVEALLDMVSGSDLLTAESASLSGASGALILSCSLALPGGAALPGEAGAGALVFPSCAISGRGGISLPEPAEGRAGFRLSGGHSVILSSASFAEGRFLCSGEVFPPADMRPDGPLSFPDRGISVEGVRALALSTSESGNAPGLTFGGARLESSSVSFAHSGKSLVSLRGASIVSFGAAGAEGAEFGLPLGAVSIEGGVLSPGESEFPEPVRIPGYAEGLAARRASWGPGGFRLACEAVLPGFLGSGGLTLPELSPGPGGELHQAGDHEAAPCAFLGSDYSLQGLKLLPGGAASLDSLIPSGEAKRRLGVRNAALSADGTLFPEYDAVLYGIAGDSDFKVSGIRALPGGGLRLSGSATLGFASEGHIFSGELETEDLGVSASGELGIGAHRWLKERIPAFLGLVFRKAEFAFREGRAILVLSEGTFAGSGIWPTGGEMHGLALDLDSMKYDLSGLSFPEPAALVRPEGSFTLSSFRAALDDAYLFSGSARLRARPGAPWAEGEELAVKALRIDAYGNLRELVLVRDGREFDGKAWVR